MFSTRRILAVTALCAVTLVTGCSGDDDGDPSGNGGKSDASASGSETPEYEAPCEANVEITGKVEESWTGGAEVTTTGGQSTYAAANGEANVLVLSGAKKQPGMVTVAISGDVLSGKPGAKGVDGDPKGGGAEVDTDVTGKIKNKPVTLHVVATFECDD